MNGSVPVRPEESGEQQREVFRRNAEPVVTSANHQLGHAGGTALVPEVPVAGARVDEEETTR